MTGPTAPRAAPVAAGWVLRPPIDRAEAEAVLGAAIQEEVWRQIEHDFARLGQIIDQLAASRLNANPKDEQSYISGLTAAEKRIGKALDLVLVQMGKTRLNDELYENAESKLGASVAPLSIRRRLEMASDELLNVLAMIRSADFEVIRVPSEAQARRYVAARVYARLKAAGLPADLTGWREATMDTPLAEADMTPAEQLISALGVIEGATPSRFVRNLRGALGANHSLAAEWFAP